MQLPAQRHSTQDKTCSQRSTAPVAATQFSCKPEQPTPEYLPFQPRVAMTTSGLLFEPARMIPCCRRKAHALRLVTRACLPCLGGPLFTAPPQPTFFPNWWGQQGTTPRLFLLLGPITTAS